MVRYLDEFREKLCEYLEKVCSLLRESKCKGSETVCWRHRSMVTEKSEQKGGWQTCLEKQVGCLSCFVGCGEDFGFDSELNGNSQKSMRTGVTPRVMFSKT